MCPLGTVCIVRYPILFLCPLDQNLKAKLGGPESITIPTFLGLLSPSVS